MPKTFKNSRLSPPAGLRAEVEAWWRYNVGKWEFSDGDLEVLRVAAQARDRSIAAQELLRTEGLTVRTARGSLRAHPAARVARAAEMTFLEALRQLGLGHDAG